MSSAKEVYDHMGNYFSSLSGCANIGVSVQIYILKG